MIKWLLRLSTLLSVVVIVLAIVLPRAVLPLYARRARVTSLPPLPETWTDQPSFTPSLEVCHADFQGFGALELAGFSIGPYDVLRDPGIFARQMEFFFGPNWTSRFDHYVEALAEDVPCIVYQDLEKNASVVGLRGFSTVREVVVQGDLLALMFAVPWLLDLTPFYGQINEMYLDWVAPAIHAFGANFFVSKDGFLALLEPLQDAVGRLPDPDNMILTGVNVGGTLAKAAAARLGSHGIAFWSLPLFNDALMARVHLDVLGAGSLSNIYNTGGLYSVPEMGIGSNYGVPSIPRSIVEQDGVYESLCTLAEVCGRRGQLGAYCSSILGDHYDVIKDFLLRRGLIPE
jgi:hypothetical protein